MRRPGDRRSAVAFPCRSDQSHPEDAFVAGQTHLRDGWDIGHQRRTCLVGIGQRAQLAGDDLRIAGRVGIHLQLHHAGEKIGHRRRRALVGNVRDLDAEPTQHQLGRDVRQRSDARGGIVQLTGILPGVVDKALEIRERRAGMADQQLRDLCDDGNRDEVLLDIVRQLRIKRRADGVVRRGEQQRVAVGRGLGGRVGRDGAAGAGAVVDDERPARDRPTFSR